jgi:enolase
MIGLYRAWMDTHPIVSIEDGLDENDWQGFTKMTAAQGNRLQIVGDDIFVTGSACRGERISKYRRLLEIDKSLGASALFEPPFKLA